MSDQVLLCATKHNFDECLALAHQYGIGLEIQTFAYPDILDGETANLNELVKHYHAQLRTFQGRRTMHGPFIDMASGSPDRLVQAVVRQRVQQTIEIAAQLSVDLIVFHPNFIASLRNDDYRTRWVNNQIAFWQPLTEQAARYGITLAMENMWEFEPQIIAEMLDGLKAANICTCLDVGHAFLYSDPQHDIDEWLRVMQPYLHYTHLNNHNGRLDQHSGLLDGVIDYTAVLEKLRRLTAPPAFALEVTDVRALRNSLTCFDLPLPVTANKLPQ